MVISVKLGHGLDSGLHFGLDFGLDIGLDFVRMRAFVAKAKQAMAEYHRLVALPREERGPCCLTTEPTLALVLEHHWMVALPPQERGPCCLTMPQNIEALALITGW